MIASALQQVPTQPVPGDVPMPPPTPGPGRLPDPVSDPTEEPPPPIEDPGVVDPGPAPEITPPLIA